MAPKRCKSQSRAFYLGYAEVLSYDEMQILLNNDQQHCYKNCKKEFNVIYFTTWNLMNKDSIYIYIKVICIMKYILVK